MRSLSTSRVRESRARTRGTVSPADPPGPATTTASGASGPSARSIAASSSSTSTRPSTGTPAATSAACTGAVGSPPDAASAATPITRTPPVMSSPRTAGSGSQARLACGCRSDRGPPQPARPHRHHSHDTGARRRGAGARAGGRGARAAPPAPPPGARTRAPRVVVEAGRLPPPAGGLVAFPRGGARGREVPRREGGAVAEIDDAVDLGRLAGRAALPRERRVLARPVHEHVDDGAHEPGVALPRDPVLNVLDDGRTLGGELRVDLIGIVGRRRAGFGRVREHAEPVETRVLEEREEVLERGGRLAPEAHQPSGAHRGVPEGP